MSVVKQIGLVSAGCQPWNTDVCAVSVDRFAYCATQAVYIYQHDAAVNEFHLCSIMSEHSKTITSMSWNPHDPDLIASCGADNKVIVWDVAAQKVISQLTNNRSPATSIGWCPHEHDCVSFMQGRGLFLWNFRDSAEGPSSFYKEAQGFRSDVSLFRWHPQTQGKIAFGHADGSMSFIGPGKKSLKHVLLPETDDDDEFCPVTALEWDPLSTDYLLTCNMHCGVRLIDSTSCSVLNRFILPSAAAHVHTLSWISTAPGMFLTGDSHTGILRIWTVSKSSPIENLRVKKTGFHALCVTERAGSRSHSVSPVSPTKYALPHSEVFCAFLDGGVGLYDLGRRKWSFLRELGHIETIFDCRFKPDNPDLLATASFDGTIKIWDVNTLTAVDSSPGNEGVIYTLSWGPPGLNHVAAATSRKGIFIWDLSKGKVITRFTEHGKGSVYSVAWNQKDSRRIASCGGDGFCIIREVDGKVLMKYKHPGVVYGCDWNPNNKDMIATGCDDHNVRIFYMATAKDKALKVFSGHTAKVFNVRWSPLREGILCSGSDDCTVRIWDYTSDACISVLKGHSGPVRGLVWNTEIPYLLISGSWDSTIRVWDTRDGACIDTVLDHGADVYGLTSHPDRPFVLGSSSRDSTVRVWSLRPLLQPLEMRLLAGQPLSSVITTTDHAMSLGVEPFLTGRASRELQMRLVKTDYRTQSVLTSKFFATPGGVVNLWQLVDVIQGQEKHSLTPAYGKGIMHHTHMTSFKAGEALELEMAKVSAFGSGLGAPSKEDRLRDAADIFIRLGNVQKYCELQVELGQWERALAVAPSVSMKYWKSLATRYTDHLIGEDSDVAVPYCVATGDANKLVHYFTARKSLQEAMLTAAAAQEGNISVQPHPHSQRRPSQNGDPQAGDMELLEKTSTELANWYLNSGQPILAACCHLTVDDCAGALSKLIRGNELELAVSVGTVLGSVPELTDLATLFLSKRCERIGLWDLAIGLLQTTRGSKRQLIEACARCGENMSKIDDLHTKAGLPSMEECLALAQSKQDTNLWQSIELFLLSTAPERGLELGLADINASMSQGPWQAHELFDHLQLLAAVQTEKLQKHKNQKMTNELLVLCAYVGGLQAISRGYDAIVPGLFNHAKALLKKGQVSNSVSLSESLVTAELEAWQAQNQTRLTTTQQGTLDLLMRKVGPADSSLQMESGQDCVMGSQLPSHSDVHYSYLTGHRIQGAPFFLEDGKSVISVNEALMWAKVNPFSPLGSGCRINPF